MPFTARKDGEIVCPYQVPADASVECPVCDGVMRVRGEHTREGELIPRVFVHDDASECQGETRAHQKLKSIAAHSLEQWFESATVYIEKQVPDTERIGDVVLKFPEEITEKASEAGVAQKLGNGLVVEAQVEHKSKDKSQVTSEYLSADYSVVWAYPDDIRSDNLLEIHEERVYRVWPDAVPSHDVDDYYHDIHTGRHMFGPGGDADPREMEIVLPREYYQVHGHDLASPRDDYHYNEMDTVWLSDGRQKSWVGILHKSGHQLLLEFWRQFDNQTDHLGNVPITRAEDIKTIRGVKQGVEQVRLGSNLTTEQKNREWFPVVEGTLTGTDLVSAHLTYGYADGNPVLEITRSGPAGNTRSLRLGWGDDIQSGLGDLADTLTDTYQYLETSGTAYE